MIINKHFFNIKKVFLAFVLRETDNFCRLKNLKLKSQEAMVMFNLRRLNLFHNSGTLIYIYF